MILIEEDVEKRFSYFELIYLNTGILIYVELS